MDAVQICNLALGYLATPLITALEDDTDEARACTAFYAPTRDAVLEDRVWSFAKQRFILDEPMADAPPFDFNYQFQLPGNVVRVHRVDDGTSDGRLAWELSGRRILTDAASVNVIAVVKEDDASLYSPAFCMAVAARLAANLAIPLVENPKLQEQMFALYQQALKDAAGTDGSQGRSERIRSDYLSRRR